MKRRELSALLLGAGVGLSGSRANAQAPGPHYPPGNVLNYGADPTGDTPSTQAFKAALAAHDEIYVPSGRFRVSEVSLSGAGKTIRGESRWNSRLIPAIPGRPMIWFELRSTIRPNGETYSSYGHLIENLHFQFHATNGPNIACEGINLGSINNTVIRSCRFEGASESGANADGVVFAAPNNNASYSNSVVDCNFQYCRTGVRYDKWANNNTIIAGEFISCLTGVDAAPDDGELDTPRIFGSRLEGCGVGVRECATQGMYFGLRFERNSIDVKFEKRPDDCSPGGCRVSTDTHFFGGSTADTVHCFVDVHLVKGLVCLAPEFLGNCLRSNSAQRPNEIIGPNVFAPVGDTGTIVNPPGAGTTAAYFRGGRVVLDNQQWLVGRTLDGSGIVYGMNVNANNVLELGASGKVDVGNTSDADRTRIFKPSFLFSGGAVGGTVVNKFPVYNSSGALVGYVPVYSA